MLKPKKNKNSPMKALYLKVLTQGHLSIMSILMDIFKTEKHSVKNYADFWHWFKANEKAFFKTVKSSENINHDFFNKLSSKLSELRDGFYYLAGMIDDDTAELILTADGAIENIVYVEELVDAAPHIPGWKFTALKSAMDIRDVSVGMRDHVFHDQNLSFYANEHANLPDEIDITVVYHDFDEDNKTSVINGVYIFLDNFLGELNFATTIDNLTVVGPTDATNELVPITKLKDFLVWRQKEFVEKYGVLRYDSRDDVYSILSADLDNGNSLTAVVNPTLLEWDGKASHPWMLNVEIHFPGEESNEMPRDGIFHLLEQIEKEMMEELQEADGYLNAARQTSENGRNIYFVCQDFRKPSKVADHLKRKYSDRFEISFSIYKDKYWQTLDQFRVNY